MVMGVGFVASSQLPVVEMEKGCSEMGMEIGWGWGWNGMGWGWDGETMIGHRDGLEMEMVYVDSMRF